MRFLSESMNEQLKSHEDCSSLKIYPLTSMVKNVMNYGMYLWNYESYE